jgi:hypothetical protein
MVTSLIFPNSASAVTGILDQTVKGETRRTVNAL